jgi:hypothetical protein
MTTAPRPDPRAAFPNPAESPQDADLQPALGRAFAPVRRILADLAAACPQTTAGWQYSKQVGWYRVALLKKRRLFYLVPRRGGFRLSLILGGKAIAALQAGPHAHVINALLPDAKRYPEGTAFSFEHSHCDPNLISVLLAAKISH